MNCKFYHCICVCVFLHGLFLKQCVASDMTELIKSLLYYPQKVTFTCSKYSDEVGSKVFRGWLIHLRSLNLSTEECSSKCEINQISVVMVSVHCFYGTEGQACPKSGPGAKCGIWTLFYVTFSIYSFIFSHLTLYGPPSIFSKVLFVLWYSFNQSFSLLYDPKGCCLQILWLILTYLTCFCEKKFWLVMN